MKLLLYSALLAVGFLAEAQPLPQIEVQTLGGAKVPIASLHQTGKPTVVSFWATWCKPCINELNSLAERYEELQEELGVTLVAVSIDDSRTSPKVGPFVAGQGWDYTVVLDPNSDLRRAMGVNNVPHTFLLNGAGEIVWQVNKYVPGEEEVLIAEIRKLK
ncbi:MAG: TlpA family protein disulfide reductase [Cryomorphaceae bacterium]|nr:TlpA family protein disulfide reductase [Cryomorphaceae bacterium]